MLSSVRSSFVRTSSIDAAFVPGSTVKRHQFAPLLACLQHPGDAASRSPQDSRRDATARCTALVQALHPRPPKLQKGPSRGQPVKWLRILNRSARSARPRKQRQRVRNLRAHRIDGANIQPARPLQQRPPKSDATLERRSRHLHSLSSKLEACSATSPRLARSSCSSTRSRSSDVALCVNVIASTSSGCSTDSSASKRRYRCTSSPVFPEPAGASTMHEDRVSSACRARLCVARTSSESAASQPSDSSPSSSASSEFCLSEAGSTRQISRCAQRAQFFSKLFG